MNYEPETMSRYELAQSAIEAEARVHQARVDLGLIARRHVKRDLKRLQQESARLEDSLLAGAVES